MLGNKSEDMTKPLVSVLICTYNAKNYILNTINSVLEQTYPNIEILILDNHSTDGTIKEINKFRNNNKIKIYLNNINLGAYGGLNYLFKKAKGDYIAIQDHDDLWHPAKINEQIKILENNKQYVGCGTGIIYYYERYKKYKVDQNNKISFYAYHPSLVFKNKSKLKYRANGYAEDTYFMKNILCKKGKIYNLPEPYLLHIIRKDSLNYSSNWSVYLPDFKMVVKKRLMNLIEYIKLIYNKKVPFKIREYLSINLFSRKCLKDKSNLKQEKILRAFLKYLK